MRLAVYLFKNTYILLTAAAACTHHFNIGQFVRPVVSSQIHKVKKSVRAEVSKNNIRNSMFI